MGKILSRLIIGLCVVLLAPSKALAAQILSSEVIFDRPQKDGRRYVRVKFVAEANDLSTRDFFVGPRLVAGDFNLGAWMISYEPTVLQILAREEEELGTIMQDIENPLTYAQNANWSTRNKIFREQINYMLQQRDARVVIWLEPVILFLRANFTGAQIAAALETDIATVQRINRRVDAILTDAGTVKDKLVDFDTEEGEI